MPPAKTPPQAGLPLVGPPMSSADVPATKSTNIAQLAANRPSERVADRRDPMPTQGPGSAAGEVGDSATRAAFVAGAPLHDGKAIAPPAEESEPVAAPPPPAAEAATESPPQASMPPAPASPSAEPPPPTGIKREPLPFYPTNTDEMWRYAQMLARSKLLPKAFYPKGDWEKEHCRVADVHVVLMKGHDLGLKPMQSIGTINVIDGKAEVGALLMVALVLKSGMCESWKLVHSDDRRAVYKTRRIGDEDWTVFEYTIEEADQMGLLDKGKDEKARENNQWKKQPRTMLRRRCQSMLCREVYPDICMALYDHDELAELREREIAIGVNPDRVIAMNGLAAPALPEGAGPGAIERMTRTAAMPADPLKARLEARRAAAGGTVARCSLCDTPLDPRDSDPCIACRPDPIAG